MQNIHAWGKLKELKNACTYTEKMYFCNYITDKIIMTSK